MRLIIATVLSLMQTITLGTGLYERDIPAVYQSIAFEHRIPPTLLFALVLNESRKMANQQSKKRYLPWPWTINHRGRGHYFKTREAAFEYMKPYIEQGDSMGIGLGQIEWRWHKDKFESAWEALDPIVNLNVAAGFLREQFERDVCGTWELAIGCYHRPAQGAADKVIAGQYTQRVLSIWKKIR